MNEAEHKIVTDLRSACYNIINLWDAALTNVNNTFRELEQARHEYNINCEGQLDDNKLRELDREAQNIRNRLMEEVNITARLCDEFKQTFSNFNAETHRIWHPKYIQYALDNNLCVTDETCLEVCNRHHANSVIATRRNVKCFCNNIDHTYTFGSNTCSVGTTVNLTFNSFDDWGFISYSYPLFTLEYE